MKTINGFYLDLKESEYKFNFEGLTYFFSSELYMNKFKNNVKNFIEEETLKLRLKYKINLVFSTMLAISYYKKTEKRGYRIEYQENERTKNLKKEVMIIEQLIK